MARTKGAKNKPKEPEEEVLEVSNLNKVRNQSKDIKKQVAEDKKIIAQQKKETDKAARNAIKLQKQMNIVYEYTPLAETALGATSLYNLYGVVIDA